MEGQGIEYLNQQLEVNQDALLSEAKDTKYEDIPLKIATTQLKILNLRDTLKGIYDDKVEFDIQIEAPILGNKTEYPNEASRKNAIGGEKRNNKEYQELIKNINEYNKAIATLEIIVQFLDMKFGTPFSK